MKIIKLEQVDFDGYENRRPRSRKHIATFVEDGGRLSPHGKCDAYFEKMPPVKLYLGYDGEVYPQFFLKKSQGI